MSPSRTANRVRMRPWPVWLFVAIALLFNISIPLLIDWLDFGNWNYFAQALLGFAGIIVGECCFVALVSGLTKRTWLGAYLFGLGLCCVGYVAALGAFWLNDQLVAESIAGLALLPAFLLVAVSPLSFFRHCFGWRLIIDGDLPPPRQPLRLTDIFSLVAVVATVLVLVRVPQVISEADASEYWLPLVITCLILFGTSLILLPLHARVALGDLSVWAKALWLAVLPVLIGGICFGIMQCFASRNTSWDERLEALPYLLTFLGAAVGMFYLSLLLLSAGGMRLVRKRELKRGSDDADTLQQVAHLQRLTWWRIGGAVAVTMATSAYLANLVQWRAFRDKENATLRPLAQATGGELGIFDRIPTNLTLGPQATDDDLARFTICTQLEYLYLNGSQISDDGLAMLVHFPMLKTLSLSNMHIADAALVHLRHLPRLKSLQIEKCDIRGTHIFDLPNKQALSGLNLTQTHFGDDECERLAEFSELLNLQLNYTRITDHGLASLGKLQKLNLLNLVGTNIEGRHLPAFPALGYLDLSETNANDVTASAVAKLRTLQRLSLRDTKITNAALPALSQLPELYRVDLSDNLIDDAGIREWRHDLSLVSIDLSGTRITGSGFVNWQSNSQSRNILLDRTPINDAGVGSLISLGALDELSLADTAVTDACLPHLAQISIDDLDISGTQITFNGLITNGLPSVGTLHVKLGQFSPQQVAQLRQQLGIKVTNK
ncbi:MAG TPA: hypothetical protein VMM76_10895 [Pirellulaceae bacterium]|nr:hypothetical protein [Pirellulaceae bacterium]